MAYCYMKKETRGGYRKGSGRKKKEPTKVFRVPIRLLEKFKEFLKTNKI